MLCSGYIFLKALFLYSFCPSLKNVFLRKTEIEVGPRASDKLRRTVNELIKGTGKSYFFGRKIDLFLQKAY